MPLRPGVDNLSPWGRTAIASLICYELIGSDELGCGDDCRLRWL